jgi:hypothetical protein
MCGSDPVRILEGEENLSPVRSAERRTLERLGLGAGCRMACVSRVQGPVVVDPSPAREAPSEPEAMRRTGSSLQWTTLCSERSVESSWSARASQVSRRRRHSGERCPTSS